MTKLKNEAERYMSFVKGLEELTKKTGVVIQAIGGVYIVDDLQEVANIEYTKDHTSGDIEPLWD